MDGWDVPRNYTTVANSFLHQLAALEAGSTGGRSKRRGLSESMDKEEVKEEREHQIGLTLFVVVLLEGELLTLF